MIHNLISMFRTAVVQFLNLRDFYSTSGGLATILIRRKYCQEKKQLKVPARHAARSQLKTTGRKIEIIEINNTFYRSSEFPAQIPQILRKILRICQLFKVLPQRSQDQRTNSNTFSGWLMDQSL